VAGHGAPPSIDCECLSSLAWQALGALPGEVEIVNACGSPAWQALGAWSGGDCAVLRGGSLGECSSGRAE
jgi:hypothetical protein